MLSGRGRGKIRPPRRGLTTPGDTVDFDSTWKTLSSALYEIHTKNASKLSFEELYRNAYRLVLKKKGEDLYNHVKAFEEKWLSNDVRTRVNNLVSGSLLGSTSGGIGGTSSTEKRSAGERFLKGLKEAWEDHNLCMNMTTDVLMYMDRVYCTDSRRPSIFVAAMLLFRDCILRTPLPGDQVTPSAILTSVILDQIQLEREGDIIDKSLIRSCIYMLEGLYETDDEDENSRLYLTSFEEDFLQASRAFYRSEGETLLRDADAGTFLRHTKRRLLEEEDRCQSTLSHLTTPKIKAVLEEELIMKTMKEVIETEGSGAKFMLDNDRIADIALLFDLISRVDPTKEELKNAIQKRILEQGTDINKAAMSFSEAPTSRPVKEGDDEKEKGDGKAAPDKAVNQQTVAAIKWVDDVLQLKMKYDDIWERALEKDQGLQTALTRSFTEFINAFHRSSEYISLFLDENLKKGLKGKTDNEVDEVLEKAITLIRYIQDKDLFERYYKKHLSRRLLMGRSVSMDVEKQMISRMKIEIGNHFTQKLEGMFKDMSISSELGNDFTTHIAGLGSAEPKRVELGIHVLTTTYWPMEAMGSMNADEQQRPCIYPAEIDRVKQSFEGFYLGKHSGRKLTWMPTMGTADVRATFPKIPGKEGALGKERRHELNVSTYAMIILLLFNDLPSGEHYTFDDIQAKTNIPRTDLIRNLQSLAVAPKTRVLRKEPMSKEIARSDKFYFNETFQSKFLKIKVGVVAGGNKVEADAERKETEKKNNDSRIAVIEAAVVRIMKQRKELAHQQLITEVISQLVGRFKPDVNMLKKRIESLIEREYLERVEDADRPAYRYLA